MARYKDEQCRICRREGQKLFLKGERCFSDKCSVSRRNYGPGQHGQKKAKLSEYGTQLREKQKTKSFYGVGEKQFRKYFEMASNKKGVTGENLLQILESRLDNVIYRLGYGASRAQARQLVNHGLFDVNGRKVDIASYLVKAGDVIGYLGMTGYSTKENVNNINVPHLHFGMQLIFDESQKEGTNQIWIDVYQIIEFLRKNKSEVMKEENDTKDYTRKYDIIDPCILE